MSSSGEKLVKNQKQETTLTNIADDEIDSRPRPRLCHLKKWPHFQGYGFNLHAERAKTGQHIGKVDASSPAESAGLKENDRIIEVNNVNISNENHQQVVKRIRNGLEKNGKFCDDEVVLLVLDPEADVYYRNLNVIVKSDFKNILQYSTKTETEDVNNNENNYIDQNQIKIQEPLVTPNDSTSVDKHTLNDATNTLESGKVTSNSLSSISQKSINSNSMENSSSEMKRPLANELTDVQNENLNVSSASMNAKASNKDIVSSASNLSISSNNQSNSSKATTPNIQTKAETNIYTEKKINNSLDTSIYEQNSMERRSTGNQNNKLDPFQMSAAEFKTYLKSKGRVDPRITQVDMRQKFQMFQDM